jgi:aspartyl-tRNA(Asn)/glutamyl-tRNA(Gln) amidotransferase subunit B
MRSKEEANDYRYFPDPDLLPLEVTDADRARVKATMPELPEAMKARFETDYGLSSYDASVLTDSKAMADYFEIAAKGCGDAKLAANWVIGELSALLNRLGFDSDNSIADSPVDANTLAQLINRNKDGTLSAKMAKEVLADIANQSIGNFGETVDQIIARRGFVQISDSGAIEAIIDEVLAANAAMVAEFKAGKEKAFNALVGQCMKASKGKANPAQVNEILKKKLAS